MLDVHGGPDIDTGGQQFLCVLPALGVARAGGVAVGQLVKQHQRALVTTMRGAESQCSGQVKFQQGATPVRQGDWGQARQAGCHGFGLASAMRFNHADNQGRAPHLRIAGGGQHGVGLAHACVGSKEDLEPAAPCPHLIALHLREQCVRIRAGYAHGRLL